MYVCIYLVFLLFIYFETFVGVASQILMYIFSVYFYCLLIIEGYFHRLLSKQF